MSEIHTALTDDVATLTQDSIYEPFSYDGYQIVRREMFARTNEPAVVIRKKSITFNTACINGLEDAVYIEILVNPQKRSIAIRQSDKNKKEAQRWCVDKPDKRRTRSITSTEFTQRLYALMNWSDKCRYKIQGEKKDLSEGTVYFFDLKQCDIIFEKKKMTKKEMLSEHSGAGVSPEERAERQAEEQNMVKKPFYPDDWENSFGVPVSQQRTFDLEMMQDSDSFVSIRVEQDDTDE